MFIGYMLLQVTVLGIVGGLRMTHRQAAGSISLQSSRLTYSSAEI